MSENSRRSRIPNGTIERVIDNVFAMSIRCRKIRRRYFTLITGKKTVERIWRNCTSIFTLISHSLFQYVYISKKIDLKKGHWRREKTLTLSSSSNSCGSLCLRLLAPLSSAGKPSTDLGRPPRMARLPSSSSVPTVSFRFTVWYAAEWPGRGGGGRWILSWGLWGELLAVASPGVELGEEDEVCACGAGTTSGFGSLRTEINLLWYCFANDPLSYSC